MEDKIKQYGWIIISEKFVKCQNGHRFKPTKYRIETGRCRRCAPKTSYGEEYVRARLVYHGIEFLHDKAGFFNFNKLCRPDFYIPSLNLIIEYDGEQHFIGRKKYRRKSNILDRQKDNECFARKIHCARIPYTATKIEIENAVDQAIEISKKNEKILSATQSDYYKNPVILPFI